MGNLSIGDVTFSNCFHDQCSGAIGLLLAAAEKFFFIDWPSVLFA
jgi:hypothetical protein